MLASSWLSVCPSISKNSAPTGQMCMTFDIWVFFEKLSRINFSLNLTRKLYYVWRPLYIFFIISRLVLHRMRSVSDINCRENQNTHFIFDFFFLNCAICEIMWKNIVEPDRPQMTIWYVCIARQIHKATNTHSKYVILIAFPLQQWLHKCASLLCYTYIASLVLIWVSQIYYFDRKGSVIIIMEDIQKSNRAIFSYPFSV
jgi:hypothetical protein